jgi:diacylglycerol O-acyltransferase
MQQLSPQDAQFLYAETAHNLTHVTAISIYDPSTVPGRRTVRFTEIIEHVRERLAYNPMLRRRLLRLPLELDYPYWVEDEYFDLEAHVSARPSAGARRLAPVLHSHGALPQPPPGHEPPPWEMYVVEGLDNVEGLAPGATRWSRRFTTRRWTALRRCVFLPRMDADNRGTPLVPLEPSDEEAADLPSVPQLLRRALRNNLGSPLRIAETLMRSSPGLYRAAQTAVARREEPKHPVPATRFNVDVSPHKMFDAREFDLADLKTIRTLQVGVTINDVVLAICAGALRRYLEHHGELPEDPLVAWVPINARPAGSDGGDVPGNNITAMTTPIFTDVSDALERLRRIHRATQSSKEARSGISARLMTDITQHVPAATQIMASRLLLRSGVAARLCNLFVSNVPGPQVPTYMNGARLVRSMGMAPLADGMGLFIATPSYDGRISFNVISTREILPDIDFFMRCIEAAKAELLDLATAVPKKKARKKRAAPAKQRRKTASKTPAKATAAAAKTGRRRGNS